jgi:LPPG:FO 2-phospho-L-lactate transferase
MLGGLVAVTDPSAITAIVNVGDDLELHGLRICPDLDTITYTLAAEIDLDRGWGLRNESWQAMATMARYGGIDWFNLGDRDLGTHLYRTQRLREGASLTEVTSEITRAWGLAVRLLPATEDRLRTMVTLAGTGDDAGREVTFQEYFVQRRHAVPVASVRFDGASSARPAPGVLDAIAGASRIVVAPSNPIVSIDPVLAVPGVRAALEARRPDVVAISPIVAGAALKGPASRLLAELGHEASVAGVARLYASFATALVIDEADAARADEVRAAGMVPIVARSVMRTPALAGALATAVLGTELDR